MLPRAAWLALALAAMPAAAPAAVLSGRLRMVARGDTARLALPASGPGSLQHRDGGVVVQARLARGAVLPDVGTVLALHPAERLADLAVAPRDLRALAAAPGVEYVGEALAPMTSAACQGAVVSEGDAHLRADAARAAYGVDGSGVRVGVLAGSFDTDADADTHQAGDVLAGDLPGPGCGGATTVLADSPGGTDEGRAMAQIIHDVAPGADIGFVTANPTQQAFADNIRQVAAAGARVIVDDVTYFGEPFFQDGVVANAVSDVTAAGVTYFAAAGNSNVPAGASYQAPAYRDTACPAFVTAVRPADTSCHDFAAGSGSEGATTFTLPAKATVRLDLQWAQPQAGVTTDLDLFVNAGTTFQSETRNTGQNGSQMPFEFLALSNPGATPISASLAIARTSSGDGAAPRLAVMALGNGADTAFTGTYAAPDVVGPTIFGHSGSAAAQSVAAMSFATTAAPEPFSARGPVTLYFAPVDGTTPAAPLDAPQQLDKPDITASDCGHTTFFSGPDHVFCGTSAAAPHAAGVAALQLEADPDLTPAEVKAHQQAGAAPVPGFGHTDVGAGLLDAAAAIAAASATPGPPPPAPAITLRPAELARDATPTFAFSLPPSATAQCRFDAAPFAPCSGPGPGHTPATALADGPHTFAVRAVVAGAASEPATAAFVIDTQPPAVRLVRHPPRETRSRTARFVFTTLGASARACRLDERWAGPCAGGRTYAGLRPGAHVFTALVQDAAGNAAQARFAWRVRR